MEVFPWPRRNRQRIHITESPFIQVLDAMGHLLTPTHDIALRGMAIDGESLATPPQYPATEDGSVRHQRAVQILEANLC
jgi:hypothetical protein